jgi:hypothetical protein
MMAGPRFAGHDHSAFRPEAWVTAGLERMRPIAERHALTVLQLARRWNLAAPAGALRGPDARRGARCHEADRGQRAELAAVLRAPLLSDEEIAEIRAIGNNTGCMGRRASLRSTRASRRPIAGRDLRAARAWRSSPSAAWYRPPERGRLRT